MRGYINITNDIKEEAFNKIKMISFLFRMKNINIHCKPNSLSAFEYFIYINKNIYADNQLTMDEYIHLIDSLRKHFKLKFRYVKDHCIKKDKQITFELIDNYVDLIDLNQKGFVGRSNFLWKLLIIKEGSYNKGVFIWLMNKLVINNVYIM